jgi:uncharacterized membrane protein (DUF4010 family)
LLELIDHRELGAGLQLLVLSVVVLPLLPDAGYGPYGALNPYRLWWAVVLVAGISLAGHFAVRLAGVQRGLFFSGLVGGLVSSTAATLSLSRRARELPALATSASAASLASCGVMFLRVAVIVATLQPALGRAGGPGFAVAGLILLALGALSWRRRHAEPPAAPTPSAAPFDLSTALAFGILLGLLAVLGYAAQDAFGTAGLYTLAALSGLADVDGILVSVTHMQAAGVLPVRAAVIALWMAVLANLLSKGCMAWVVGGAAMGRRVIGGYGVETAIGASLTVWQLPT